jgi:hypothetical protein
MVGKTGGRLAGAGGRLAGDLERGPVLAEGPPGVADRGPKARERAPEVWNAGRRRPKSGARPRSLRRVGERFPNVKRSRHRRAQRPSAMGRRSPRLGRGSFPLGRRSPSMRGRAAPTRSAPSRWGTAPQRQRAMPAQAGSPRTAILPGQSRGRAAPAESPHGLPSAALRGRVRTHEGALSRSPECRRGLLNVPWRTRQPE